MIGKAAQESKEDITASLIRIIGQVNRRVTDQERQIKLVRDTMEILIEEIREFEDKYQVTNAN
ncbi:MAG: hypothetical protein K0R18_2591 [Bacillales bacterium]|nr:hypothetical protein [Bacillales bacterium]